MTTSAEGRKVPHTKTGEWGRIKLLVSDDECSAPGDQPSNMPEVDPDDQLTVGGGCLLQVGHGDLIVESSQFLHDDR